MPGLTPRQREALDIIEAHPDGIMRANIIKALGVGAEWAAEVLQALKELGLASSVHIGNRALWKAEARK
jgi:hypothetical protein